MKNLLKIGSSVILTVAMLFSCFAVGVSAYYGQEVEAGETVSSVVYGDNVIDLIFTPEETGLYNFYSKGDVDTVGYVMDTEYNVLAECDDYEDINFYIPCYLTEGETYLLQSMPYYDDGNLLDYSVCIERSSAGFAEEIFIFHGGETTGYVDNYLSFECMGEPEGSYVGECYWESDNENVAVIDYTYGSFCDVYFTGVGTANITVTTEFGLTDTIEVRGIEIPEIKLDEPEYVSFGTVGGVRYFEFTASRSGMYAAYSEDSEFPGISVYDSEWEYIGGEMFGGTVKFELSAGESCYLEIAPFLDTSDMNIIVTECVPAQSIEIINVSAESSQFYVGMTQSFWASFAPDLAKEETVTWSVNDTSVASVEADEYFNGYCDVTFKKAGKVTLTVKSKSGLSDSIELECFMPESIALNEEKSCVVLAESVFKFVPAKTGPYVFLSEGEIDTVGVIYDNSWNMVRYSDNYLDDGNFSVYSELTAGETYYLSALAPYGNDNESFTVKVTEPTGATKLSFAEGDEIYGYVDDYTVLTYDFGSISAKHEMCTVDISDKSVINLMHTSEDGCVVSFVGEGSAVLTATGESGLVAKVTIYCKEISYTALTLDEEIAVEIGKYPDEFFEFTPLEDGIYSFMSIGDADTYVECLSALEEDIFGSFSDDDSGEGENFCYQMFMEAGETYRFRTCLYDPADSEGYSVVMQKSVKADSISIFEEDTVFCQVGESIHLTAEFLPYGSEIEEVHWRISDRSVIEILDEGENYFYFNLIGEGVAIVEAHTDSGLYAEVTVVCGETYKEGDVNGDGIVSSVDSNMLKRYIAGDNVSIIEYNCDLNGDGSITSVDSNLLKRMIAGK